MSQTRIDRTVDKILRGGLQEPMPHATRIAPSHGRPCHDVARLHLRSCGRTGGPHGRVSTESDGRRVFTLEFKRVVVQQLLKGENTLAEVSRELDIQPSVVRQWKRRFEAGATAAVATNQDVVPVSARGKPTSGFASSELGDAEL